MGAKMFYKDTKMTILVASPNQYKDVFEVFLKCFKQNWKDCPYDFVLATNNQHYENIRVINSYMNNDTWTSRALLALREIKTKYVLILCDDIFISRSVNNDVINQVIEYMDMYDINFCRLKPYKHGKKLGDSDILVRISKKAPYSKNLQKGIYNREYLMKELGNGDISPWDLEKKWVEEAISAPNELHDDVISARIDILPSQHGVSKGKWFPSVLKFLDENGIEYDSSRPVLSTMDEIKHNLKSTIGDSIPLAYKEKLKKMLRKFGWKFTT